MANVTDVNGSFSFDFSKTGKTEQEAIEWLARFEDVLSSLGYPTFLCFNKEENPLEEDMSVSVNFYGDGCWSYEENIKGFANLNGDEDYQNLLKEMNGLVITIEYDETSDHFEGNGRATLTIQGEKAKLDGEFFGDELSHNDDNDNWNDEFDDDDDNW